MVTWFSKTRSGPIGIDFGARSLKLVQFTADNARLLEAVRWDFEGAADGADQEEQDRRTVEALERVREGRAFRGRDVVLCLGPRELFMQNIRVPRGDAVDVERAVQQEAAGRIPFSIADAEIRFIEAGDVRQGDDVLREVILFACPRDAITRQLDIVQRAGLNPVSVDVEPAALLRAYGQQFRRDEDQHQRVMYVRMGYSHTAVVIAAGQDPLFVKYIDVGGKQMDDAVAKQLRLDAGEAAALRRHNGDRRADQQDPDISRSVAAAIRPTVEKLAKELAMCVRYHSVTFRGTPLARMVLAGGEANQVLSEELAQRLNLTCDLGDPLRDHGSTSQRGRAGQWDVATGLAIRQQTQTT
jgi:type IV pilus assembly protein PilM